MIGADLSGKIEFVCSDMWKPYLRVIRERCSNALNILDRFHIVAKMNDALADVRRQVANYKRFKELCAQWVALGIEHSKLKIKLKPKS